MAKRSSLSKRQRKNASSRFFSAFPTQDTLEIKCDVNDSKGCSEKEVKFIDTMKATTSEERAKELTRLSNMKVRDSPLCILFRLDSLYSLFQAGSMKPELKQWLVQRLNVLKQLQA